MLTLSRGFAMSALKHARESATGNGKDAREIHLKTHYGGSRCRRQAIKKDMRTG